MEVLGIPVSHSPVTQIIHFDLEPVQQISKEHPVDDLLSQMLQQQPRFPIPKPGMEAFGHLLTHGVMDDPLADMPVMVDFILRTDE